METVVGFGPTMGALTRLPRAKGYPSTTRNHTVLYIFGNQANPLTQV